MYNKFNVELIKKPFFVEESVKKSAEKRDFQKEYQVIKQKIDNDAYKNSKERKQKWDELNEKGQKFGFCYYKINRM